MDLLVRFTGKDGRPKTVTLDGVGLPRAQDVRRRKGETKRQALDRTIEGIVRKAVFGVVNAELGQMSGEVARKLAKRTTKKTALKLLNKAKRTRAVKFGVKIYRED